MGATYTRVDDRSDLVRGLNQLIDRDQGGASDGRQIRWTQYDGVEKNPHTGATLSSNNRTLLVRNTAGFHVGVLLAATGPTATPTAANSVVLIDDAGLFIGNGKVIRLYDAAGTDYAELSGDADGGLVLGGSGTNAGLLTLGGNIAWKSGTANTMTLDHAATANRTITFQDLAGTVALLGAANTGSLLFVDATHDIGASGATRPRDLFLSRNAVIGGTLQVVGVTTHNAAVLFSADNTHDVGASGATRPRDLFLGRNAAIGGTATVTGLLTASAALTVTTGNLIVTAGNQFIGDTSNAFMTRGLTINQAGNDDDILSLKSTDVNHGVSLVAEDDTYAAFQKQAAASGGLRITALDSTTNIAFRVRAIATTANTARTTAAVGAIVADSYARSGSGTASLGANANLFVVRDNDLARFLVDAEGDIHMDATSNINAWDDEDDVALLEAFRITTAPGVEKNYRQRFSADVAAHAEILARTGVITLNEDGHHFVSMKGLNGLMIDAIRMLAADVRSQRVEIGDLRQMLAAGK